MSKIGTNEKTQEQLNLEFLNACSDRDTDQAARLLKDGADVNAIRVDHEFNLQSFALLEAADSDRVEMVKFLLEHGANPNLRDINGTSALMWACQRKEGGIDSVKALLDGGADINLCDLMKNTALMCAVGHGNVDVVEELLKRGCYYQAKNSQGKDALSIVYDRIGTPYNDSNYNYSNKELQPYRRIWTSITTQYAKDPQKSAVQSDNSGLLENTPQKTDSDWTTKESYKRNHGGRDRAHTV